MFNSLFSILVEDVLIDNKDLIIYYPFIPEKKRRTQNEKEKKRDFSIYSK
jgi:hypothetical protein